MSDGTHKDSKSVAESAWESICAEEKEMKQAVQRRAETGAGIVGYLASIQQEKNPKKSKKKKQQQQKALWTKTTSTSYRQSVDLELNQDREQRTKSNEKNANNMDDAVQAARKAAQRGIIKSVVANDNEVLMDNHQPLPHGDAVDPGYLLLQVNTLDETISPLQRLLPSLSSESTATRKQTLEVLNKLLFNGDDIMSAGLETDSSVQAIKDAIKNETKSSLSSKPSNGSHNQPKGIIGAVPDSDDEEEEDDDKQTTKEHRDSRPSTGDDVHASQTSNPSKTALGVVLLRVLIKPLSKRIDDESEKCREMALSILIRLVPLARVIEFDPNTSGLSGLPKLPPNCGAMTGCILPLLVSALMDRVPQNWAYDMEQNEFVSNVDKQEEHRRGRIVSEDPADVYKVVEPAEEVRLLICRLCGVLVEHCKSLGAIRYLDPHLHDLILSSHCFAIDPFPLLRIEGCQLVRELALLVPYAMKHFCVGFVKSLAHHGCLTHRHSKVRLAALEAIRVLVRVPNPAKARSAGAEGIQELVGYREDNVVPIAAFYGQDLRKNYFGTLCGDKNNIVRQKFFSVIADWILKLPETDLYEQEARLEPYVLSALSDSWDEIAESAVELIDKLGRRYEEQHRDELIDKLQYGVDGDPEVNYDRTLPKPFTAWGRPRLGARLHVRKNVRRFLNPVLKELSEQGFGRNSIETERIKSNSAKLLTNILIFMEEHMTEDMQKLLPALGGMLAECGSKWVEDSASAITFGDETDHTTGFQEVALQGTRATRLTGRYVPPSSYVDMLVPLLANDPRKVSLWRDRSDEETIGRTARLLALLLSEAVATRALGYMKSIVDTFTGQTMVELITLSKSSKHFGLSTLDRSNDKGESIDAFDCGSLDAGLAIPDTHIRAHVVSLSASLGMILVGRVGAIAGAVYDTQGRIADTEYLLSKVIYTLLLVIDVEFSIHWDGEHTESDRLTSPISQRAARVLFLFGHAEKRRKDELLNVINQSDYVETSIKDSEDAVQVVSAKCKNIVEICKSQAVEHSTIYQKEASLRVLKQLCNTTPAESWLREWQSIGGLISSLIKGWTTSTLPVDKQRYQERLVMLTEFMKSFVEQFCEHIEHDDIISNDADTVDYMFQNVLGLSPSKKKRGVVFSLFTVTPVLLSDWCYCIETLCSCIESKSPPEASGRMLNYASTVIYALDNEQKNEVMTENLDSQLARSSSARLVGNMTLTLAKSLDTGDQGDRVTVQKGINMLCTYCDDSRMSVQRCALSALVAIASALFVNERRENNSSLEDIQENLLRFSLQGLTDRRYCHDLNEMEKEDFHSMLYSVAQSCCTYGSRKPMNILCEYESADYEEIEQLKSHCELLNSLGSRGNAS